MCALLCPTRVQCDRPRTVDARPRRPHPALSRSARRSVPRIVDIASVGGIAVRAHISAFIAFGMLVLLLASAYFPMMLPRERAATYWSVAFICALFLFL